MNVQQINLTRNYKIIFIFPLLLLFFSTIQASEAEKKKLDGLKSAQSTLKSWRWVRDGIATVAGVSAGVAAPGPLGIAAGVAINEVNKQSRDYEERRLSKQINASERRYTELRRKEGPCLIM